MKTTVPSDEVQSQAVMILILPSLSKYGAKGRIHDTKYASNSCPLY